MYKAVTFDDYEVVEDNGPWEQGSRWGQNDCSILLPGESFQGAGQGRGNQPKCSHFLELRRHRWDTGKASVAGVQLVMCWREPSPRANCRGPAQVFSWERIRGRGAKNHPRLGTATLQRDRGENSQSSREVRGSSRSQCQSRKPASFTGECCRAGKKSCLGQSFPGATKWGSNVRLKEIKWFLRNLTASRNIRIFTEMKWKYLAFQQSKIEMAIISLKILKCEKAKKVSS